MKDNLQHRMEIAAETAWEAGKITLRYFQTKIDVEIKTDQTPVTVADKESEAFIYQTIHREFPEDGFLGEERGERPGSSGYRWIVDPIDGTKSFIQGVPLYGVMIALADPSDEPVIGAIALPGLDELIVAARGEGCYWNGRRAWVSDIQQLSDSCVLFTDLDGFTETGTVAAFERICSEARVVRGWGDCYGHILVATGRAEVMLDPILADWDAAALLPIVEEAGGTFTDWSGNRTAYGKSGISTNGKVTAELRQVVTSTS